MSLELSVPVTVQQGTAAAKGPIFPLYADLLQIVVRHLTASELHLVAQLSKQWLQVLGMMKPLELVLHTRASSSSSSSFSIPGDSCSVVSRHIREAVNLHNALRRTPELLAALWKRLPNLQVIRHYERGCQEASITSQCLDENGELLLPSSLKEFTGIVCFDFHERLLLSLSALGASLQVLHIRIEGDENVRKMSEVDFSSFLLPDNRASLQQLREFHFEIGWEEAEPIFSPTLLQFLRQSSTLRELSFECGGGEETFEHILDQLAAPGPDCPLIQSGNLTSLVPPDVVITRQLLDALIKFPSLTKFHPMEFQVEPSEMRLLAKFVNLTSLRLAGGFYADCPFPGESIVIAAKACPNLYRLKIQNELMSTVELDEALSALPHLSELGLEDCSALDSLKPLLKHSLPRRLKRLRLTRCLAFPSSEIVECIFPLQQLVSLDLVAVCNYEELPPEVMEGLQVDMPSSKLPMLEHFYLYP